MQHDHSTMHPCDTTVLGNMDAEIGLLQAASWLHRKRTNQGNTCKKTEFQARDKLLHSPFAESSPGD